MKPEAAVKVTYGIWGLIVGAIITMIIGFAWGGWRTAGKSNTMIDAALLTTRAAICVAQVTKDPNYQEILKEFMAQKPWDKAEFIEKGGWDRMPGEKETSGYMVSRACADGLQVLIEK